MDLSVLRQTIPDWFRLEGPSVGDLLGRAIIEIPGAVAPYEIGLRIWIDENEACVQEPRPDRLPSRCPERHVNSDGTFCLGFNVGGLGDSLDGAHVWWGLLREFLKHQRTAEKTGLWPVRAAISHGMAGVHHVAALDAASKLGITETYHRLIEGEPCWIDDGSVRVHRDGTRLVNGRSPCPMRCLGKRKRPILRRECCKSEAVLRLVVSEMKRKSAEKEFWNNWTAKGYRCCGTMRGCPARDS
ncbi:MAG: hypothetical protein C0519_04560 [Hyphomicrobium sp.]|nr:hypothetical protein [Hyphomicrobium sp.]